MGKNGTKKLILCCTVLLAVLLPAGCQVRETTLAAEIETELSFDAAERISVEEHIGASGVSLLQGLAEDPEQIREFWELLQEIPLADVQDEKQVWDDPDGPYWDDTGRYRILFFREDGSEIMVCTDAAGLLRIDFGTETNLYRIEKTIKMDFVSSFMFQHGLYA